ncbi:uncharacterized protein [Euwallacea fornicatus]|uniref:uncharacterized protein isoform X2 n=1 Tax=Euwallacea fornicatus TaxID=995702 RepID=UPI00338F87C0
MNQCARNYLQNRYYDYYEGENDKFHQADYCEDMSVQRIRRYPEEIQDVETTCPTYPRYYEPVSATEGSVRGRRGPNMHVATRHSCSHPTTRLSYEQNPTSHQLRNHLVTTRSKSPLCQFRHANTFSEQTASTHPQNSILCGLEQDVCEDYYKKYEGGGHTWGVHQNRWVLHQKHEDGEFGRVVNKDGFEGRKNLVTPKMHKYVSKNSSANVKKRPSVLFLPVDAQPDSFLTRRKSKTHEQFQHPNRISTDSFYRQSSYNGESFSAHKMNSEGDVKGDITIEDLDIFMDNFETDMAFQNSRNVDIKEISKFLKLKIRVPSSVKMRHQQLKSRALAPKMKMSLDKLMDRLRKCDGLGNHSDEKESCKSGSKMKFSISNPKNAKSFTYDSLARKYPPNLHKKDGPSASEPRNPNFFNNLFPKESARTIHVMDNQKELCCEVADSIIANASVPYKEEYGLLVDRGPDKEIREKSYTFPEYGLTRKKSETNQHLKSKPSKTLLDNFENNIAIPDDQDVNVEEILKSWNPKASSLVQMTQEQEESKKLAPKMNMSMDKLPDRLQNCDNLVDHAEEQQCCKSSSKKESSTSNSKDAENINDDSLTRKYSPLQQRKQEQSGLRNRDSCNSILAKRSKPTTRAMDDHCALDLHKSKSYILDLIDRALSKELGTVPRNKLFCHDMTPSKAIATIALHQRTNVELTDSLIANATASDNQKYGSLVKRASDNEIWEQPSDETYIRQLKQLRWDHILHIQNEAKELADLEEFLEKYNETHQ